MSKMLQALSRPLRAALRAAKGSKLLRSLLTDLSNTAEFTNLAAHERMVADRVRVDCYHAALRKHVKPGDVVIDLGTGTGILSMFAAQAGPRRIYALDHSPFIEVARRLAAHNKADCIEFVSTNSRDFKPAERADLLIHEQLGDECFTENMVENLLDLKRRALKPGGRILPARFEFFVEPLQLKPGRELPPLWQQNVHGVDFSCLKDDPLAASYKTSEYPYYFIDDATFGHWLGVPRPALYVDLDTLESPAAMPDVLELEREVTSAGVLDGFGIYFRIIFDDELSFDTSPTSTPTHWRCRFLRSDRRTLDTGVRLRYRLRMPDLVNADTWQLEVED
ncbi:MAG: hypothetical protein RL026_2708 [Pseudomonadota bacterium]|jgi:protein arginine N-methyltransferase 1